jgi:EmrB/QacA subfamily drug resistance transporter
MLLGVSTPTNEQVELSSPTGRWVLAAAVLGSGMAFLDATLVNVALPRIGQDLDADLAGLQWTANAYVLTLASLILLGGALGDRLGRRRVFLVGVVWFAVASAVCGLAWNVEVLVVSRALQGVGGALLTPGSLAIMEATYVRRDRARAIGAWSGLGGLAGAIGPLLGGSLVQLASWRWAFLVNVPLAALVVVVTSRFVPESRDPDATGRLDLPGAALAALGLAGLTAGLTEWPALGPSNPWVLLFLIGGVLSLALFLLRQRQAATPLMPLGLFRSRDFSGANGATFLIYGAMGGVMLFLVLGLQELAGFSPLAAGAALLPMTILLLLLSARMGALAQRIGPRLPMTAGPILAAAAVAWLSRIGPGTSYLLDVLPPVALFGLGMATTVAPLTATVLAAVDDRHAGIASGVNNAVARTGGLLAVAALPAIVGLSGEAYADTARLQPAFHQVMLICAGLLAAGGLVSLAVVTGRLPRPHRQHHADGPPRQRRHCDPVSPPLAPRQAAPK